MKTLLNTSQLNEYVKSDTEIVYRRNNYTISYSNGKLNAQADIPANELSLEKICYISDKRSMIPDFLENKIDKKMRIIICKTRWRISFLQPIPFASFRWTISM